MNQQTPPAVVREGYSPGWIVFSMAFGFLLPICTCSFLALSSLIILGSGGGSTTTQETGTGPAVAIIRVEGSIVHSDEATDTLGASSGRVIADIEAAVADPEVKAIVLRVDSSGGTVTGSAQIYEALLKVEKPVVISMVSTAASGGYYISMAGDYIFARPDTLTGSLGVIVTMVDASQLLEEYGVKVVSVTSGPHKDIGNPWSPLTTEQTEIFQASVDEAHDDFVQVIMSGRKMDEATVREIADGRFYTGRQALTLNLIDELGDLDEAVTKAAALGGITGEPRRIEYEQTPSFTDFFMGMSQQNQLSETDLFLQTMYKLSSPVLEYRFTGQ